MVKVLVADVDDSGHHISYLRALLSSKSKDWSFSICAPEKLMASFVGHPFDYISIFDNIKNLDKSVFGEFKKFSLILKMLIFAKKKRINIFHLLYLDRYIFALYFATFLIKTQGLATLHWAYMLPHFSKSPYRRFKSAIERKMLSTLSRRGWTIVVHSRLIKSMLENDIKGINVEYVPYPVEKCPMVNKQEAKEFVNKIIGTNHNGKVFLLFGDTRYDKGVDIAIKALATSGVNATLLIAGKSSFFSKEDLLDLALRLGVQSQIVLYMKYIPDDEIPYLFNGSDAVLIPYRSHFSGQSGPLTIAASYGIPVFSSDPLVLKEMMELYQLGYVFKADCAESLANLLKSDVDLMAVKGMDKFIFDHSLETFVDAYYEIYKKVI